MIASVAVGCKRSRERRISSSFRNELDDGTTSVPLVGCSGC
jgi:hypothetical protein